MSPNPLTPMPVGSPHVARPPLFDRWGLLPGVNRSEKRAYSRRAAALDVWFIDIAAKTVVRCKTDNICDAGLHATSPVGYGLAVGQRFEVRIANASVSKASSPDLAPSLGYATIVRLEIDVRRDGGHRIGFAVRFDVPQLLPV